ncbi:MAG: hypothetical protein SNI51_07110 [Rikenellaceae bacterium]
MYYLKRFGHFMAFLLTFAIFPISINQILRVSGVDFPGILLGPMLLLSYYVMFGRNYILLGDRQPQKWFLWLYYVLICYAIAFVGSSLLVKFDVISMNRVYALLIAFVTTLVIGEVTFRRKVTNYKI